MKTKTEKWLEKEKKKLRKEIKDSVGSNSKRSGEDDHVPNIEELKQMVVRKSQMIGNISKILYEVAYSLSCQYLIIPKECFLNGKYSNYIHQGIKIIPIYVRK